MKVDGKLDYLELRGGDMAATKRFYAEAFGWSFTDFGPDYAAFDEGLEGGFWADADASPAPLPILWAKDLEAMELRVVAAGAEITKPIFAFPGGRRFHFRDPAGNELACVTDIGGL
jgi:predicted enzyme related to lactoylglutathione lyase